MKHPLLLPAKNASPAAAPCLRSGPAHILAALGLTALFSAAAPAVTPFQFDHPAYLSGHDIVTLSPPMEGYEGFPLGNGDVGAMIWCTKSGLSIQINKNDTWDQANAESEMLLRSCGRLTLDLGAPASDWLYLDNFVGRLSLGQAQASVDATTPFLQFSAQTRVQANRNVLIVQVQSEGRGDLAEQGSAARISLDRWGSRAFGGWYHGITRPANLGLGQAAGGLKGKDLFLRETLKGLDFALACRVIGSEGTPDVANRHMVELTLPAKPTQKFTILLAIVTSGEAADPLAAASNLLDECEKTGLPTLQNEHEKWWTDFWQRSFVHLGDDYLENLYYHHLYLMGSASRGRYPVMFNGGLWTWNRDVRQWISPHHWNMQQAYWSVCAANHPELLKPYLDTYWRLAPKAEEYARRRGFTNAVLWNEKHDYGGRMLGAEGASFVHNFTPASQIAQFFWQYYLYTGDRSFLGERAYPFMKKAAEVYVQYLKWDETRKEYFIFPASPYECEVGNEFKNTVTDLAMIQVSFRACIAASELLGVDSEKRSQWEKVLQHLAPYVLRPDQTAGEVIAVAVDKENQPAQLKGGDGATFCANLAPVFPSGALGLDQKGTPFFDAAVRRAKAHPENTLAITPIAVAAARLGLGEEAARHLATSIRQLQHFPQGLFYNLDHWNYLSRYPKNGVLLCQRDYIFDRAARYKDISIYGAGPTKEKIDTPTQPFIQCGLEPSAILAAAVNEMLLQSYSGNIRVFPATPATWPAAFTLRAAGGFLVSSERAKGQLPGYVLVRSLLGNPCRLVVPWPGESRVMQTEPETKPAGFTTEKETLQFATSPNALYLITPTALPASQASGEGTRFTGKRNMTPKTYQEAVLGRARDF